MSKDKNHQAYLQAIYKVYTPSLTFELKVGEGSTSLEALLLKEKTELWALLTAANPQSKILSEEENAQRNSELEKLLRQEQYRLFPGENIDPQGIWPVEKSFLVLGISEKQAIHMAKLFNQKALLLGKSNESVKIEYA
jgi:hypothetical protein